MIHLKKRLLVTIPFIFFSTYHLFFSPWFSHWNHEFTMPGMMTTILRTYSKKLNAVGSTLRGSHLRPRSGVDLPPELGQKNYGYMMVYDGYRTICNLMSGIFPWKNGISLWLLMVIYHGVSCWFNGNGKSSLEVEVHVLVGKHPDDPKKDPHHFWALQSGKRMNPSFCHR